MEITCRCFCYYYQTSKDKDLLPLAGLNPMFFSCQDKRSFMIWLRLIPVCSVFFDHFRQILLYGCIWQIPFISTARMVEGCALALREGN